MAKIVIDARYIKSTYGRYIERLLYYLEHLDTTNDYSVILRDFEHWRPTVKNFEVVVAPIADFSFAEQLRLKKIISRLQPDLVHFPMPQFPLLYRGKRITTIHDVTMLRHKHSHWNPVTNAIKRTLYRLVTLQAVTHAHAVITPTRYVKTQLLKLYSVDPLKIHITYEAADKLAVRPKEFLPLKNKQFIFYVGSTNPHKNIPRLIQAYDLVKSKHPKLHLVIVGRETRFHTDLRKLIEYEGIKDVMFSGFMSDNQLVWLYNNALAYVVPSLSEGFGLPGLEAIMHDCPLVSSNASCLPEVYGPAAYYFDPTKVEDMAKAINQIVENPNLRKRLQLAAKGRRERYSWLNMAHQTLNIYRQALGQTAKPAKEKI